METLDLHRELEAFVEAIDFFPASDEKSMFYNIEALLSTKKVDIFNKFFGKEEYKKALKLIRIIQEAIKLCKLGEIEKGYVIFQDVQKRMGDLALDAQTLVRLSYLSGLAYYFFRKNDFQKALEYTWEEIRETESLEEKGLSILHFRRVGHIGNATRILYESQAMLEATKSSLGEILYSLNGDITLMPKGNWDHKLLDLSPYVRQRYLDISFLGVVERLIENQDDLQYNTAFFYNTVFSKIHSFEVTNNNLAMINNWLYIQKLFNDHLYKDFIECSVEYCQVPFDYTFDILKLSLLSQLIILLRNSNNSKDFKGKGIIKINNYIANKLIVKQPLKEKVCNLIF